MTKATNLKADFNDKNEAQQPQNLLVPHVRDADGTGYDIFSLLLKDNIIVVQGGVDSTMASVIVSQILFLHEKNKDHFKKASTLREAGKASEADALIKDQVKPIVMLVNSPGGSVVDGLAIYDAMRSVDTPIVTVGNGMQASMGSIILCGGDERYMHKNSELLIHQIMYGLNGGTQHSDALISDANVTNMHERLKSVYVEFSGLNHDYWDIAGERDTILTAQQALEIGFIHGIKEEGLDGTKRGLYAADAKRPASKSNIFDKVAFEAIAKMKEVDLIKAIAFPQANRGQWGKYRPELIVRLAKFKKYWTPTKKMIEAEKAKPQGPAAQK